jgi:hypothetical protein
MERTTGENNGKRGLLRLKCLLLRFRIGDGCSATGGLLLFITCCRM